MRSDITISIIGAGNLGTQLGLALSAEGYFISQIFSRNKKNADALARKTGAKGINDLWNLSPDASIYIIAVKDDAIEEVARQLKLKDQIVVHTSGSVPVGVLKGVSKNYGVFYPLQTFSKENIPEFKKIPICIEANNTVTATTLQYFAKSISTNVQKVNSEQRRKIHLAAVFACNFSNHMYTIAELLLSKDKLSLDLLRPLIAETAEKVRKAKPARVQTGPAVREDQKTVQAHLKMLAGEKDLQKLYFLLSQSIIKRKA